MSENDREPGPGCRGSLAEDRDAHQHSVYALRFQRDEEQAAEAVSHEARA